MSQLLAFNRGLVSPRALARVDLKRLALAAAQQTNWVCESLGPMALRPGFGYTGATRNNLAAKFIPFVFATDDTAEIEVTAQTVRVWVDDAPVSFPAVSTAVTNGAFTSDVSGWTDADESGATSDWNTGGSLRLRGTGYAAAIRRQQVSVAVSDRNVEHALQVVVARGRASLRVGSSAGADDYVGETTLLPGVHVLAFTPTGNFHIEFSARAAAATLIDSVAVRAAGALEITAPWASNDLDLLRWAQSGDVVFVACEGHQPRRIERRGAHSWSVARYEPEDGPFRIANTTTTRITATGISGDVTLTASRALFRAAHVGALFKLNSVGQRVEIDATGEDQWTDPIRISGIGNGRVFRIVIAGTWAGTVRLQRSMGEPGAWVDTGSTWTANVSTTYNDDLDNQVAYYRLGIKAGGYTSGTADLRLTFDSGSIAGIARITGWASQTEVTAAVLKALGSTDATEDWAESVWSDDRGWPGSVAFYEGRLWWSGNNWIIGSVSDAYDSFDDELEGDAAPIIRTIGDGPVDSINWILPAQRLLIGAQGAEISARSTSFDEPLTPTNFNLKDCGTEGSAAVPAVKVGSRAIFVQRNGRSVYELAYDVAGNDYVPSELSVLVPEIGAPGFVRCAVQRKPDTRWHGIRSDGTAAILLFNPAEELKAWIEVETDGAIEDVVITPGTPEDVVVYVVRRTVDGATVRYREKWALGSECLGGTLNKQADSFVTFTNAPASATVSGLSHLVGESVVVWADGKCLTDADGDIASFTVSNAGTITLTDGGTSYAATTGVVGLPYTARFKSAKLGQALTRDKRIVSLGLCVDATHAQGLWFGPDFATLDNLPLVEDGAVVDQDSIWSEHDFDPIPFPGRIDNDTRLCLEARAPRPARVLAAILNVKGDGE
jgi:hypothetical protein